MKIYLIYESHWETNEGEHVHSAYYDKEKAEAQCEKLNKGYDYPYYVEEIEVIK